MMTNNSLKRLIFGIFPDKTIKIGQLFDLRDECFLSSSVLKTELLPAIRVSDETNVKIEIFHRPILAEFISSLSDDLLTQLKAYANLGIFNTLTTDNRIISPNSDALISIKFTFRKKVLKLREIDANSLGLDETFIAKSQFAVTEIEMGQWILASISSKNFENDVVAKFEPIQAFLESYFTSDNELSETPSEASSFLYKYVTSETICHQQQQTSSSYIQFKEFFESLKSIYDKHRCFPISVKLTSLLDLGLFTIDNRLETLQCSFDSHEFFLKFFRESEMAIFKLQEALTSHIKIFTVIILKKLRQSEIYLAEIMEKFKNTSIYDKQKLKMLQTEIENSNFLSSIETFLQNLKSQFTAKQSNFIELETQTLLNLSPTNVKFALIIGENEKQKTDFINFLINISQCSTTEEAVSYKMTTFLPYSNLSTRKAIILTKNDETIIFITIKGMDYCSSQETTTHEISKIFHGERKLNTVILLFSRSTPLRSFQKWIPKQLSKATSNFIYFNFFNRKPLKAQKWKALAEILPTGSLYFLNQKVLKQNFMQMSKGDLEMGLQNIHQILRKVNQSKAIDGIEAVDKHFQLKAYANLGIFNTLTTDNRIISPNSDALISIKFTFRKKVLKLREIDANSLGLDETFIAKSQFAVTEIEMGQWILASISSKNFENDVVAKFEPIQAFLESYFTSDNELSETPSEASSFLYKYVTSETICHQQQQTSSSYIQFKEFFESLKSIYDKHRCFPISVKLTSLLDLGLFTIDNRLETLQCSFDSHEFFLKFFRESEMAIFKLQEALTSHIKIFTVIILKKLRQSEIYLAEIMEKFKNTSIYDKQKLKMLQTEIENSNFLSSIETFLQNLKSQFTAKQSNFIELETQTLLNLSPTNVKFALIIGENEKQKTDFINFLINISQCSTTEEAVSYKMTTFLPYSNLSTRKAIILTKNDETIIFITIKGMDYCSSQETTTHEISKIFHGERKLNTVILLFSRSTPLRSFQKWIPKQLSKATSNFIYFNFFNRKPLKAQKWKALAEILPTGSLYFLNQKVLKQNFMQMSKGDLEMGLQNIHQILRKVNQSKAIDGIEGEDTVRKHVKEILDISKDLIEQDHLFSDCENDEIDSGQNYDVKNDASVFVTNLANLCKFLNDPITTNTFANKFFTSSKYYVIWDTVIRLDLLSEKEIQNFCNEIITLSVFGLIYQQKLLERSNTDIITYNCERKSGISFFNEKNAFSWNEEKVFERF